MSQTPENQPENTVDNQSTQEVEATLIETVPADEVEKSKPMTTPTSNDEVVVISRTTLNYAIIAIVFFAMGMTIGSISFGSSVDQDAIEVAVENVLVEAGIMQPPADMEIMVDDDPFLGPEDAPIVIVEFSAYACPYCSRHFSETLQPLLDNYGEHIRYVFRDFPSINPNVSFPAALAANCAREQGYFWEYHEVLFANQNVMIAGGDAYLNQVASDLGLNTASFSNCLTQQTYLAEIENDFNSGVAVGVTGTPAFYINGQAHSGARPYEYFEAIVRRELDEAGVDY